MWGPIKGYTTNLLGGQGGQGRKGFASVYVTVTINVVTETPRVYRMIAFWAIFRVVEPVS